MTDDDKELYKAAVVAGVTDEFATMYQDAARYRWLRNAERLSASMMMLCGEALDKKIDSAMLVTANVELTGAARLHRVASSDRRERGRPAGSASFPQERNMKRIDYFWPRALVQITGIVFVTQLIFELSGIGTRKPEFEWVIYACGAAFLASGSYAMAVIAINTWRSK